MKNITLLERPVRWPNFSGAKTQFNAEGKRKFSIVLDDPNLVETMRNDGWNVRDGVLDDEGNPIDWTLEVRVNYDSPWPPIITQVKPEHNKKYVLHEENLAALDLLPILYVDVVLNKSPWDYAGKKGYTAYLKSMYAVMDETELDMRYSEIPDATIYCPPCAVDLE